MVTRCPASVAIEPKHEIITKYYVYTNEYDNKFAYYWFLAIVLKDTTEIEPVSAISCNRVIYYQQFSNRYPEGCHRQVIRH